VFRIPVWDLPVSLNGRYIALSSDWNGWGNWRYPMVRGEDNQTRIRLGLAGSIQGRVDYSAYTGSPIYIQAYCDPKDPEGSMISSTMILQPGPYQLDGIGVGWSGYIRAFTPLFGFNPLGLNTLHADTRVAVDMLSPTLQGINLRIVNPEILQAGIEFEDQIILGATQEKIYAFDAVSGGDYIIDLFSSTPNLRMELLGRDGVKSLVHPFSWEGKQIRWNCPISGRYYIQVLPDYPTSDLLSYQIRLSADLICPWFDISGSEWIGVGDCRVDLADFALLAKYWLDKPYRPLWGENPDLNMDAKVNVMDLITLAEEWLSVGQKNGLR
jgi:hypothetical protein